MKIRLLLRIPHGVFIGIFIVFFVLGCSSSRQGVGLDESETLTTESGEFGELTTKDTKDSSDLQAEEDEVLRLLGISRDEKKSQIPESATKTRTETEPSGDKETGILKSEISDRDSQISSLKSDLKAKQDRIEELETKIKKQSDTPMIPGLTPISPSDKATFKTRYQEALQMYNDRRYREAISAFESLLSSDMSHTLADNAQYWIGECYYGLGNYNQAVVEFEKVFSFSNKDKFDDALLKIGLSYMKLSENTKARAEFERLISDFPKSEYVAKAELYLSKL